VTVDQLHRDIRSKTSQQKLIRSPSPQDLIPYVRLSDYW
jgi:hypothetical protein